LLDQIYPYSDLRQQKNAFRLPPFEGTQKASLRKKKAERQVLLTK